MKNRLLNSWAMLSLVFGSLFIFMACEKEELNTNIMGSKETTVMAYGPNPALRGQYLTFVGTHIDKITKVILPNNIEITDFEIVDDKHIKLLVPQETMPGLVSLIGPKDKVFNMNDSLFISEPIAITKMSPQPIKAGQLLTIEGEYFNFMEKIIFIDNVEVAKEDCKSWSRTKIEVILPAEAAPGVVTLANNDEIPLEYQTAEPLQVVLPSVEQVLDLSNKKPGDAISTAGKDLDLVVKVEMPNGDGVEFKVENGKLNFILPNNISDGAIVMIPASGVKVLVANIGVAAPSIASVSPEKGLRADTEIEIKGLNMELVTSIDFQGGVRVEAKDFVAQSATAIKVKMPAMAISGEITLNTGSGQTANATLETLKPSVVSFNPATPSAGTEVKLQGHNLDLVASVTFQSNLLVTVKPTVANELFVKIPLNAISGTIVLTMANGETVEAELEIVAPEFAYLPLPPTDKTDIKAGTVFSVAVANADKLTEVHIGGMKVNFMVYETNLFISIPNNAAGNVDMKLVSSNGEAVYPIVVIPSGVIETLVWEGFQELSWSAYAISKNNFGTMRAGDRLRLYFSKLGADPKVQLFYGDWDGQIIPEGDPNYQGDVLVIPAGSDHYDIVLTDAMINHMMNPAWGSDAMLLQGQDITLFKITTMSGNEPTVTELWKGSMGPIDWSGSHLIPLDASLLVPGKTFGLEVECAEGAQIEVMSGSWWSAMPGWVALNGGERYIKACDASVTNLEFTITQADIDAIVMQGNAILCCGNDVVIKKLYMK